MSDYADNLWTITMHRYQLDQQPCNINLLIVLDPPDTEMIALCLPIEFLETG